MKFIQFFQKIQKKKLVIKIASIAVTTAVVVDFPTPLAPPVVVSPQLQPIVAINPPKIVDLITELNKSQTSIKRSIELRNND